MDKIVEIIAELRGENGCPWDKEQDHQSLRKCLLEETYEVLEAIDQQDDAHLCEELGDLLLQVVFHAQLAAEDGAFTMADVEEGVCQKMIRRHPHVFGEVKANTAAEVLRNWEQIKKQENSTGRQSGHMANGCAAPGSEQAFVSIMNNIPKELPALLQADKIQAKAARVGFDWDDIQGPRAKITEELQELDQALAAGQQEQIDEELGDLLFSIVNLARFCNSDPEQALRFACRKFITRFQFIEHRLAEGGRQFSELNLAELDKIWDESKKTQ